MSTVKAPTVVSATSDLRKFPPAIIDAEVALCVPDAGPICKY